MSIFCSKKKEKRMRRRLRALQKKVISFTTAKKKYWRRLRLWFGETSGCQKTWNFITENKLKNKKEKN